jgi:hypothetical protein
MEDVFGVTGQALLSAIGAAGVIGITYWLLFGTDGTGGPMGKYILAVLGAAIGA